MNQLRVSVFMLSILTLGPVIAHAAEPPQVPAIAGVMGLDLDDEPGWLAVRIEFPSTYALSGILWYNNDGTVTYPVLLAGTGYAPGLGSVEEMETLATNLSGPSSGWGELEFSQPIAATQGGLYLVFAFPLDRQYAFVGEGGGAAVGYCAPESGCSGWISGDGQSWMRLGNEAAFALVPDLVPVEDGMLLKSLGGDSHVAMVPVVEPYLSAGPNPFNPATEIRFGLPRDMKIALDVYDLRGARIAELMHETLPAGHHVATWTGRDDTDRPVASGVYFARLSGQDISLSQRMVLLK